MRRVSALPIVLLFAVPLLLSLALILPDAANGAGFFGLFQHPQFPGALRLTLVTGLASTALALLCALTIVARLEGGSARAGAFLAVPHLAFAIGLGFLIMPAGLVARLAAPLFGWSSPPAWITTQDPGGLALMLALVLKEAPFLVWALTAVMNRDDLRIAIQGQRAVAASLGHAPRSIFLRVVLPQILPRILWPVVAVLAYGLTVVDMALVIGPTQPPTLAQLIWTDINDSDPQANLRGGAGVLLLSGIILLLVAAAEFVRVMARPALARWWSWHPGTGKGPHQSRLRRDSFSRGEAKMSDRPLSSGEGGPSLQAIVGEVPILWTLLLLVYAAVIAVLLLQSVSGLWPFPKLLPDQFTFSSWARLFADGTPIWTSFILAATTASVALAACATWLEAMPEKADRYLLWLAAFALCLPSLVIGLGQYRLFLTFGITGTATAMFLAHVLPVMAYVFIMLQGPYRGFDERYRAVSSGLRATNTKFLFRVKWPLLRASLLSSFAVGFAVSIAQFVPAQLAAAGRFSTLPMEAVTLTAGGNRALTAAYGLALMALPLIVFVGAGILGRPRWTKA